MSATIDIGGRIVGLGQRTLVVAEIGVNHDGSVARAIELVDYARAAGADAVKIQVFRAGTLVHGTTPLAKYQSRGGGDSAKQMLSGLEIDEPGLRKIVSHVRHCGMIPLATPFSVEDVATISRLELPAVKIASPDLVNRPLLAATARLGVPLIVSTGAATFEEVTTAADWLRNWSASFALMHCTSAYPASEVDANLCWIAELASAAGVPVGYSDHTTGEATGAIAVGAGACMIEKHLTCDRSAKGPDHAASSDPNQFTRYVEMIRSAEAMRGVPGKRVLQCEEDVRTVSRQSLVLARDIADGQPIAETDLMIQRPGTGIPAAQLGRVVGRRMAAAARKGTMLTWELLANAA